MRQPVEDAEDKPCQPRRQLGDEQSLITSCQAPRIFIETGGKDRGDGEIVDEGLGPADDEILSLGRAVGERQSGQFSQGAP